MGKGEAKLNNSKKNFDGKLPEHLRMLNAIAN